VTFDNDHKEALKFLRELFNTDAELTAAMIGYDLRRRIEKIQKTSGEVVDLPPPPLELN
jgi:hypothetical protein